MVKVEISNCGESSMFDGLIETGTFQLTWANQSRKMILDADCCNQIAFAYVDVGVAN